MVQHRQRGPDPVGDVEELPPLPPLAVHGNRPPLERTDRERRHHALDLPGAERVRAADDRHRRAVRDDVRAAQQIRGRLARRVRARGLERMRLVEQLVAGIARAVDLVGREHEHAHAVPARRLQHDLRADDVRPQERTGIVDAPIDVRLGRGVDHRIGAGDQAVDHACVGHVPEDEPQAWITIVRLEVRSAPARGEPVEHRDRGRRSIQQRVDQVGADETGAARDEDVRVGSHGGTSRK